MMMMMIAHNSRERKVGKERGELQGEYGRLWEEEENFVNGGILQPSQQHVAPREKVQHCFFSHEWGLGTRGLRMVARFGPASRYMAYNSRIWA